MAGVRAVGPVGHCLRLHRRELQAIRALADRAALDDGSWAEFVGDAEDAISREHTMWTGIPRQRLHRARPLTAGWPGVRRAS